LRVFFASLLAAWIGLWQVAISVSLEFYYGEKSGYNQSIADEVAFGLFALSLTLELIGTMVLSLYRMTPWFCSLMGAKWEAQDIRKERSAVESPIVWTVTASVAVRRFVMLACGSISPVSIISAAIPFVALLIPRARK
jgi:hypothetical protein